jgi:hypothetical protein
MILDSQGRTLRRAAGFIGGFTLVAKAQAPTVELCLVGSETIALERDDEEDAARNRHNRMRRTA